MVNQYETVFIATPVLSETQIKEVVGKFKSLIKSNKGELINEEDWGLRKLAYPIQKKSTGFYYLIEYKSDGEIIEKLETEFKRDERIIRFLTVKMDKYAIAYSEKRKTKKETEEQVKEANS